MKPSQWEIIILKPTRAFLSFLASQLPGVDLPELRLLQMDNTAYVMAKQESDEETLMRLSVIFLKCFDMKSVVGWVKTLEIKLKVAFLIFYAVSNLNYILKLS